MDKQTNIVSYELKEWQKPTMVTLSISLTKEEDCVGKIGPGSPDGNATCLYAGVATS